MQSHQAKTYSGKVLLAWAQSKLKRLLGSPLARKLLLIFSILPLIESVFLGLLCYDINRMDEIATKELDAARACQEISNTARTLDSAWQQISLYKIMARDGNTDNSMLNGRSDLAFARKLNEEFLLIGRKAVADLKKVGLVKEDIGPVETAIQQIYESAAATLNSRPEEVPDKYHLYDQIMNEAYPEFAGMLDSARQAAAVSSTKQSLFGIAPITLVYVAALANVIYLALVALAVRISITGPITKLAESCKKIQSGIAINPPTNSKNEIDSLHKSFHIMSLQIAEDKKRRSNYLEILQAVQTTALLKVQDWLEKVPTAALLNDQSARRLEKATNGISNLIKILQSMTSALTSDGSAMMPLKTRQCNTERLCQDAAAAVEALLESRGIRLNIKAIEREMNADPVLLGRVLMNLLSNAIKYSPDRGEIELRVDESDKDFTFSVLDSGPGISAEEIKKLFHKFSQLEALDGVKRSGTGLGLAICREIVEAHAGEIGCISEPGKGSTFWFKIPVKGVLKETAPKTSTSLAANVIKTMNSLNFKFGTTILAFIGFQIVLFVQMHALFQQSSDSAAAFSLDRSILLNTQGLYASFMQGGYAARHLDVEGSAHFLNEAGDRIESLFRIIPEQSLTRGELNKIQLHNRYLKKLVNYCRHHRDKLVPIASAIRGKVFLTLREIISTINAIFDMEKRSVQSSYEGQAGQNAQILRLLGLAAIADFFIITVAAIVSLRIIERLNIIKSKAEDFAAGKNISPSVSCEDELATLDRQLCKASLAIQEAEQQKQELIAVINHDLRAPLSSILSNLQMLSQGVYGQIEGRSSQMLQRSEQELHHLLSQINDLLLLEKLDSGTYELAQSSFDFAGVVADSIKQLKQSMEEKDIRLNVEGDSELEKLIVAGDRALMIRVCTILLSNAIAASPSHGTIEMAVDSCEGKLVTKIENKGQCVAPELKTQIFDRFRFVGSKPLTGMGLPLAQRLCKIHGGSIELKPDSSEEGAAFLFRLPLAS